MGGAQGDVPLQPAITQGLESVVRVTGPLQDCR